MVHAFGPDTLVLYMDLIGSSMNLLRMVTLDGLLSRASCKSVSARLARVPNLQQLSIMMHCHSYSDFDMAMRDYIDFRRCFLSLFRTLLGRTGSWDKVFSIIHIPEPCSSRCHLESAPGDWNKDGYCTRERVTFLTELRKSLLGDTAMVPPKTRIAKNKTHRKNSLAAILKNGRKPGSSSAAAAKAAKSIPLIYS